MQVLEKKGPTLAPQAFGMRLYFRVRLVSESDVPVAATPWEANEHKRKSVMARRVR